MARTFSYVPICVGAAALSGGHQFLYQCYSYSSNSVFLSQTKTVNETEENRLDHSSQMSDCRGLGIREGETQDTTVWPPSLLVLMLEKINER